MLHFHSDPFIICSHVFKGQATKIWSADSLTRSRLTNRTCSKKQVYTCFYISPCSRPESKPAFWRRLEENDHQQPKSWCNIQPKRCSTTFWTQCNLSLRVTSTGVSEKVKHVLFAVHMLRLQHLLEFKPRVSNNAFVSSKQKAPAPRNHCYSWPLTPEDLGLWETMFDKGC